MTGGGANHNRIGRNNYAALRSRPRGWGFALHVPDPGVQTIGERVRYPDALDPSNLGGPVPVAAFFEDVEFAERA